MEVEKRQAILKVVKETLGDKLPKDNLPTLIDANVFDYLNAYICDILTKYDGCIIRYVQKTHYLLIFDEKPHYNSDGSYNSDESIKYVLVKNYGNDKKVVKEKEN